MLVEPGGKPGVCAQSDQVAEKPYPRLAACLDAAGSLHMVMTKPTTLYPLSQWLIQGRLKCVTALNFSGADQAGWARLATWAKPFPKYQGGVDAPLASALLFEQK
jgi:hypothetical protein